MTTTKTRSLKVFLSYAHEDKDKVRDLYKKLHNDGFDVWFDEEKLLGGKDWRLEISKAVREVDAVIICMSNNSFSKEGFFQKEITYAIDIADEKPEGTIYLIPLRIEECNVPKRLSKWHWLDLFSINGYEKLKLALQERKKTIDSVLEIQENNFVKNENINTINPKTKEKTGNKYAEITGRLLSIFFLFIFLFADFIQVQEISALLGFGLYSDSVILSFFLENYWIVVLIIATVSLIVSILGFAEMNGTTNLIIMGYADTPKSIQRQYKIIIYLLLFASILLWLFSSIFGFTSAFPISPEDKLLITVLFQFAANVLPRINAFSATLLVFNFAIQSLFYFITLLFKRLKT